MRFKRTMLRSRHSPLMEKQMRRQSSLPAERFGGFSSEGAAGWSAIWFEPRGMVMSHGGSTPPPSSNV